MEIGIRRRVWGWILAVMMAAGCCFTAAAEDSATVIRDVQGLLAMAENPEGRYRLETDLDLGGTDWIPFVFSGELDGNGHGLYNLRVTQTGEEKAEAKDGNLKDYDIACAGLFSILRNATVRNLRIIGARVEIESEGDCFAAILAGACDHSTVENVSVQGASRLISHGVMAGVGGMAGYGCGTFKNCTALVEMVFEDRHLESKCEQFMGGILACGIADMTGCAADVSGFDSCHGYVHNGGLIGMYYHCGMNYPAGRVTNNAVTGRIHFFEDNRDRRAYCAGVIGEKLTKPSKMNNNVDTFVRDETRKTSVVLMPEMCENPVYEETVISPEENRWGYTIHRCTECGYSWADEYCK